MTALQSDEQLLQMTLGGDAEAFETLYDRWQGNFWLTKLEQFNGNYIQAEMVKAFLVSGEYRGRFPTQ